MTARKLTPAQLRALKWLSKHGNVGVIDKTGRIAAAGEIASFDAATWLRLITFKMVAGPRPNLLIVTAAGFDYLRENSDG